MTGNVRKNLEYADYYFTLEKRLNAINVVPNIEQATWAMDQTSLELQSHMPFIGRMCASHDSLPFEEMTIDRIHNA